VKTLQPNSRDCFACGVHNPLGLKLRFYITGKGEVEATYTAPDEFQGYPGVVHGGVVAAMLDEITCRSHMGFDPPRFMFTARLNVRYRKNVPVGQPLRLVGKAGKTKSRTATAKGEIYDADGELLAEADALLVDVPQEMLASDELAELGWRVYSDEELTELAAED